MTTERGPERASFADQAFEATADAYMAAPGSWPEAIHAGLARLLDFLASSPARTRACFAGPAAAHARAFEVRDRAVERFADFFEPGYTQSENPPPDVVAEAIGGGIYELIRAHAAEQRIERLPDSLPDATVLALSPFVGSAEAERLAARPVPAHTRSAAG